MSDDRPPNCRQRELSQLRTMDVYNAMKQDAPEALTEKVINRLQSGFYICRCPACECTRVFGKLEGGQAS